MKITTIITERNMQDIMSMMEAITSTTKSVLTISETDFDFSDFENITFDDLKAQIAANPIHMVYNGFQLHAYYKENDLIYEYEIGDALFHKGTMFFIKIWNKIGTAVISACHLLKSIYSIISAVFDTIEDDTDEFMDELEDELGENQAKTEDSPENKTEEDENK